MALTAQDMGNVGRLVQLAANPQGAHREEIYIAVASLYCAQDNFLSDRERGLMNDILKRISRDVEMAVRIRLAERLADNNDTPLSLILLLCDDKIEVARPIILRSKKLSDEDILSFLAEASSAHQSAVAERHDIGEPVTEHLVNSDCETVLIALARNVTAKIGKTSFEKLVEKSRAISDLQEPLTSRRDLPPTLASRMCEWVSEVLKEHIRANFSVPEKTIIQAVDASAKSVLTGNATDAKGGGSAAKLVEKLSIGGQLRASFLVRVLHQGQIELFDLAFARLLGIDPAKYSVAFYSQGAAKVAAACRAAGIDRCVFPTVYNLSRQAHGLSSALSPNERTEVDQAFKTLSREQALQLLQN